MTLLTIEGAAAFQLRLAAIHGLIFVRNMRGQYAEAESMARAAIRRAAKSAGVPRSIFTSLHCALGKPGAPRAAGRGHGARYRPSKYTKYSRRAAQGPQ